MATRYNPHPPLQVHSYKVYKESLIYNMEFRTVPKYYSI